MTPVIAIFSILFISCQGLEGGSPLDQLKTQHAGLVKEVKSLLTGAVESIKSDVDSQVQHLNTVIESSKREGEARINSMYEQSRRSLRQIKAPQVCLNTAETKLAEAKKSSLQSFITCSNLTEAGLDVLKIVFEAGKLTTEMLMSADTVLNGLGECFTWNPFSAVSCVIGWVKSVVVDTYKAYDDLRNFTRNVSNLVSDIRDQVNFCVNHGSDQLHEHFINSIVDVHQCSADMWQN